MRHSRAKRCLTSGSNASNTESGSGSQGPGWPLVRPATAEVATQFGA